MDSKRIVTSPPHHIQQLGGCDARPEAQRPHLPRMDHHRRLATRRRHCCDLGNLQRPLQQPVWHILTVTAAVLLYECPTFSGVLVEEGNP